METQLYNLKGETSGKMELPAVIFEAPIKMGLLHRVVVAQRANQRQVSAHTKDRSAVRGGGKKPWRQKGTGRARHGSIRSPLWRGGGVTFGPTNQRNFSQKINKKVKQQTILMSLSAKKKAGVLFLLDNSGLTFFKTKELAQSLKSFFDKLKLTGKNTLIILDKADKNFQRAAQNLSWIKVVKADNLNALDLLTARQLLIFKPAIEIIQKNYAKDI